MTDTDQIKVVVRVRPLIQREQQGGLEARWNVQDEKRICQNDQPNSLYVFDQIYDRDCSTWELYSGVIAPIVEAAMNGYHGTVFAYGQSGSGKTYTMSGDKMTPGVIAQAMNDIFNFIEQKPTHEFLMRASYMEIYNEKIYDLLSKDDKILKIHESIDHQINVVGLVEELVNSCDQILSVIQSGEAKRKFAETKQNDRSSRSHCIFRIIIESRKRNESNAAVMVSHLNFVDLAGSERAGDNSGDRFREGCSINMSLFCLSNVISKLSEGVGKQFIGYRDSKLTRILQNALGGNSKTVIVATISPTTVEESHSTLKFATRAKTIKNKPHVNEVLSDAALLKKYRNQITELEKKVKDMGVADIQSANEDLQKRLEEKQELIKQLTQQIVVSSSLTDKPTQKKKARRETWCAPKVHRKSYFPSLSPMVHSRVTIREESEQDLDLACGEDLGLPFTTITVSANDEAKTKAFLRRSEELALSESLLSMPMIPEDSERMSQGKDLVEEVERLGEVVRVMEVEHAEEIEKLQERIKQLEFEKAMQVDQHEEREKDISSGQQECDALKDKLAQMQYECQLHLEENQYLQKSLWHAEEDVKRLTQETCHLCSKRFDISLQEWEQLEMAKTSLETEIKQLVANLQQKDKEIEDLKKALAGQEPYIARLEQQMEVYMGVGNGQLGTGGGKRRSGIPVPVKSDGKDSPKPVKAEDKDTSMTSDIKVESVITVDCATSTEDLPQFPTPGTTMVDVTVSTHSQTYSVSEQSPAALPGSALPDKSDQDQKAQAHSWQQDRSLSSVSADVPVTCSKVEDVFAEQEDKADGQRALEVATPDREKVAGTAFGSTESSTKRATCLKRRSDGIASLPHEASSEMSDKLREQEQELEQLNSDNTRLLDVLNQANAEIIRYKEAMEAMEQADAERMEELSEIPKLRALLSRRNMEIQQLESRNDRLKEELNQQALNSSVSSLSASFTEPRRKSTMLKEREAEIWKLKEQLIQQTQRLDDVQQEKIHLEDMVVDLQSKPGERNEEDDTANRERLSTSSTSSAPSSSEISASMHMEDEVEREVDQVTVTAAELEAVQRMLCNKDSLISHLKTQLQEKEEEMDQMFEGQMLVSSDMIQSHLQQAEQRREQIEELTEQLRSREEEITKLKARAEIQHNSCSSSSPSQGEENAFLEQLIMDKMTLEENLQEKTLELSQALERSTEIQVQLNERRALVNELRQQQEDTTEALLATQEELITLKRFMEEQQSKETASQQDEGANRPAFSEQLAGRKGDELSEVSFKSQSKRETEKSPVEEQVPDGEGDDSFEVSFKTSVVEVKDGVSHNSSVTHVASCPPHLSKSVQEQDSFEISFKTTDAEAPVQADNHYIQRLKVLEERESELLEMLKKKEEQIQSLTVLRKQELQFCTAEFEKCGKSALATDVTVANADVVEEDHTSRGADSDISAAESHQNTEALLKEKQSLESRLEDALSVIEEKTVLEAKVQDLLAVVEEKQVIISHLQTQSEEAEAKSSQPEGDNSCLEPTADDKWAKEKETLLAKLSHLSHVEDCLEKNIKLLEQTEEEKAVLDVKVQQLEAKLEELTEADDKHQSAGKSSVLLEKEALDERVKEMSKEVESLQLQLRSESAVHSSERDVLQTEKETLETQVKEVTTELESLKSELQELKSEGSGVVSQKNDLEKELQNLKEKEKALEAKTQETEKMQAQLAEAVEQRDALEKDTLEVTAKMEELAGIIAQMKSEHEEVTTELTWQTKQNEELQSRVEELETDLEEQKQEAEDLVQDLEKAQKLQEDSEQCQRVVEDTLEEIKSQNAQLEADKKTLATERDEFELREEAARKEQECLKLELRVTTDRLQSRVSALEMEVQTMVQRKQVLETALADKESAQSMGELLHEKLSVDLQESQAEASTMKTTLSQLQSALQSQESKFNTLNKITVSLEAERDQLAQDKSSLENERAELNTKLFSLEEKTQFLQNELGSKQATEERKHALQKEVSARQTEIECLQRCMEELKQQIESGNSHAVILQQERDNARGSCQELSERLKLLESRCTQAELQCQHMTNDMQQLQQAGEASEQKAATVQSECSRLQDELGARLEHIEHLEKELENAKSSTVSSSGEKMIPLLEAKKQKFALKTKLGHLNRELASIKESSQSKDWYITELQEKLYKYENEEQEDKDEKIEKLEEKVKSMQDGLKAKDMELVGVKMKQQDEITKLNERLSNAEEMVTYKEQIISKLKGEIRRIRSEEVSFCASAAPKAKAYVPEPVKATEDERAISSHSGVIDRYTVTLLEADKYKLQKELKKTQDRLKCRESELHWAKVALAKAKTGGSSPCSPPSSAENVDVVKSQAANASDSKVEKKFLPESGSSLAVKTPASGVHHSDFTGEEQRSPLLQRLGTSVDGGLTVSSSLSRTASNLSSRTGNSVIRLGGDSVSRTLWQRDEFQGPLSAGGTPVDLKKDRPLLPSAVDKENSPLGTHVLAARNASAPTTVEPEVAEGSSSVRTDPEAWKKPKRPTASLYKPAYTRMGKSAAAGADQCKTQ